MSVAPHLSERDQCLLINGRLLDQLLVLLFQVPDARARVPEKDHLLAHGAVLLLQAGEPLIAVIQLGITDLSLLPKTLDLLLQQLLVLLKLGALLLQTLVLGRPSSRNISSLIPGQIMVWRGVIQDHPTLFQKTLISKVQHCPKIYTPCRQHHF